MERNPHLQFDRISRCPDGRGGASNLHRTMNHGVEIGMDNLASNRSTVLVLHQDPLLSAGVATALRSSPNFDVFEGSAGSATVDVVVADHRRALQLAEDAGSSGDDPLAGANILALTTSDREADICRAIRAGIRGYLLIGGPLSELIGAVSTLANGGRFMCQSVVDRLAHSMSSAPLTRRENEVLRLVVKGDSNKTIARRLGIELGTVKSHMSAIMSKLGASSRVRAVSIAAQRGLLIDEEVPHDVPPVARSSVLRAPAAVF
jgi:DNA-binding NarL/FixJ family response regulator